MGRVFGRPESRPPDYRRGLTPEVKLKRAPIIRFVKSLRRLIDELLSVVVVAVIPGLELLRG
jgi:hypothetical protein